jgi:hypothetical protein
MPNQRCSVCRHPARAEIEAVLMSPTANKSEIGRQYDLSRFALGDHRRLHMGREGCVESEYESQPSRIRNTELLQKAKSLHEQSIVCSATPTNMVQLMRKLTQLMIELAEEVSHG